MLVAKTPRGRQAEMCDYLVEEESLHGNFFELKKNTKNAKNMQKNAKKKCKKKQIRKNMQKKENHKKNAKQMQKKTNHKKKTKKMRKKCDKTATKMRPNQSSKNKKQKKKENKGNKKGLTTEPPGGTSKNCSTPISKAKFVLKQKIPLTTIFP